MSIWESALSYKTTLLLTMSGVMNLFLFRTRVSDRWNGKEKVCSVVFLLAQRMCKNSWEPVRQYGSLKEIRRVKCGIARNLCACESYNVCVCVWYRKTEREKKKLKEETKRCQKNCEKRSKPKKEEYTRKKCRKIMLEINKKTEMKCIPSGNFISKKLNCFALYNLFK